MAKQRSRSRKRHKHDPLQRIKNTLRGSDPVGALALARLTIPPHQYGQLLRWIKGNRFISTTLSYPRIPHLLSEFREHRVLLPIGLEAELSWAAQLFFIEADLLRRFRCEAVKFQTSFWTGDYGAAAHVLAETEQRFGFSLWFLRNKIGFLQETEGLESQKTFVAQVRREAPIHGAAAYLAYQFSIRNEPTVTPTGFLDQFDKAWAKAERNLGRFAFVRRQVNPSGPLTTEGCETVLRYSQTYTVIDAYETFIDVACSLIANECSPPLLLKSVLSLRRVIEDSRLDAIAVALGHVEETTLAADIAASIVLEAWISGDNNRAVDESLASIKMMRDPFLLDVVARARATRSVPTTEVSDGFSSRISDLMFRVAVKAATSTEDEAELQKLAMNFHDHNWARILEVFVSQETSPMPDILQRAHARFAMASLPVLTPVAIPGYSSRAARLEYAEAVQRSLGASIIGEYAFALAGEPPSSTLMDLMSPDHSGLLLAEQALYGGRYEVALSAATKVANTEVPYFRRRAVRIQCYALLKLGRARECVQIMAITFAADTRLFDMLPIADAVERLASEDVELLKVTPLLAIAYDMYLTVTRPLHDKRLKYAYQDFLEAQRVRKPSELPGVGYNIPHSQLVYFLRYVATESVMEGSIAYDATLPFSGSRELTEERLGVCRKLLELDPDNADEYEAEILELVGRLFIRDRLPVVNQRRIYVDLHGVTRSVGEKVRESFKRYSAFLQHGLHADAEIYQQDDARKRSRSGSGQGVIDLPVPQNETRAILLRMAEEMRDEFVSNSAYGLEGYLSLWIRHGALVEHLRSPVEAEHLITRRVGELGEYQINTYWETRIGTSRQSDFEAVHTALSTFSSAFDELLTTIRDQWIRVKRNPSDLGLLDFTLSDHQVNLIAALAEADILFDEFVATVNATFEERLEQTLVDVRYALESDAEVKANSLLTALQEQLHGLSPSIDPRELNNAIARARSGLQNAFDQVGGWFHRSVESAVDPVSMRDAVAIAAESMRTQSRVVVPNVYDACESHPPLLKGSLLQVLTPVFAIVFDNHVRHSGFSGLEYHADVRIDYPDGGVRCRVETPVQSTIDRKATQQKLDRIKKVVQEKKYMSSVPSEGGTGFYKIAKVLTHDVGTPPKLDFGFVGEATFFVEFSLPGTLLHR